MAQALVSGSMETKTCGLPLLFNFEPHPFSRGTHMNQQSEQDTLAAFGNRTGNVYSWDGAGQNHLQSKTFETLTKPSSQVK